MRGHQIIFFFCGCVVFDAIKVVSTGSSKSGCNDALGIQTGFLEDRDIKTSSSQNNFTAYDAWCPTKSDEKQFFAVDLGEDFYLTKVATQGKEDIKDRYTKQYILQFSEDAKRWTSYKPSGGDLIDGNKDTFSVQSHDLTPPIIGRYVKLLPKSWNNNICTRMELYGCSLEEMNKKSSENKAAAQTQDTAAQQTEAQPVLPQPDAQPALPQPEAPADSSSVPAPSAAPSVVSAPSVSPQQNSTASTEENKPTR